MDYVLIAERKVDGYKQKYVSVMNNVDSTKEESINSYHNINISMIESLNYASWTETDLVKKSMTRSGELEGGTTIIARGDIIVTAVYTGIGGLSCPKVITFKMSGAFNYTIANLYVAYLRHITGDEETSGAEMLKYYRVKNAIIKRTF